MSFFTGRTGAFLSISAPGYTRIWLSQEFRGFLYNFLCSFTSPVGDTHEDPIAVHLGPGNRVGSGSVWKELTR